MAAHPKDKAEIGQWAAWHRQMNKNQSGRISLGDSATFICIFFWSFVGIFLEARNWIVLCLHSLHCRQLCPPKLSWFLLRLLGHSLFFYPHLERKYQA